jgi:hypothetical protein
MNKKQEKREANYLIIGMLGGLLIGFFAGLMIYGIIIFDYEPYMDTICQKAGFEEYDGFNHLHKTIICKGELESEKTWEFDVNEKGELVIK